MQPADSIDAPPANCIGPSACKNRRPQDDKAIESATLIRLPGGPFMRRRLLLCLAFLSFSFSIAAQTKHAFTFEDMMKLKRVGDPQVSPDGKWVIFSVVDVDLAANTKTSHIWITRVGADASPAPA